MGTREQIQINGMPIRIHGNFERVVTDETGAQVAEIEVVVIIRGRMPNKQFMQLISRDHVRLDFEEASGGTTTWFTRIGNHSAVASGAGEGTIYRHDILFRETPESYKRRMDEQAALKAEQPPEPVRRQTAPVEPEPLENISEVLAAADPSGWGEAIKQLKNNGAAKPVYEEPILRPFTRGSSSNRRGQRREDDCKSCFVSGLNAISPAARYTGAMNLAKQHLDIGLFSNRRDEQLAFWQETVGLPYDHMGKVGGGVQQHRHHMNGSILKMNHSRDPLPAMAPSGIVGLQIAREGLSETKSLADPDGNPVTLVPMGQDGVAGHRHPAAGQRPCRARPLLDARHAVRARGRRPLSLRRFAGRDRGAGQGRASRHGMARAGLPLHHACRSGIALPSTRESSPAAAPRAARCASSARRSATPSSAIPTATTSRSASGQA